MNKCKNVAFTRHPKLINSQTTTYCPTPPLSYNSFSNDDNYESTSLLCDEVLPLPPPPASPSLASPYPDSPPLDLPSRCLPNCLYNDDEEAYQH